MDSSWMLSSARLVVEIKTETEKGSVGLAGTEKLVKNMKNMKKPKMWKKIDFRVSRD